MSLRALLAAWLFLPLSAGAGTLLVVQSQPGDPVGNGLVQTFAPADGPFTATRNFDEGVSVRFDGLDFWFIDFAADGAVPLVVGSYPNAVGFNDNGPGQNAFEIARGGNSCYDVVGAFQVHEVVYGAGDEITSFAADFVQRCAYSAKTLSGAIRFNSDDALPDAFDDDGDGAIEIGDNCPGLPNADQHDGDLDLVGDACDPSAETSFILFDSEEGDYVGQGLRQHFNAANSIFTLRADAGAVEISFGSDFWRIDLSAPGGNSPGVGVYENATRFGSALEPSLDVGGDGRGCNQVAGRFEVFEAEYGPNGEVLVFSADFEQHCEGGDPALHGKIRWRAATRPAPPGDLDGDGWLVADDNCPGVPNPPQYDADADGRGDGCGLGPAAQKCVNDFNKSTAAVVKAQNVSNLACLKNAQKGATDKLGVPATAQDCLANDVGAKVAGSLAKLAAKDGSSCSAAPDFGRSDVVSAGEAARQASRNLMSDLFGATLDTAIVLTAADAVGAKCREEVAKRTHGAVDALWKLTLKQKKALLLGKKVLAATDGDELAEGLVAFLASDPKGAVSKPFAALAAASAKRCTGVADLAAAFPGCAPADLPGLNACAERSARCRYCQVLAVADGLAALDCDLFDNETADLSCQQTP